MQLLCKHQNLRAHLNEAETQTIPFVLVQFTAFAGHMPCDAFTTFGLEAVPYISSHVSPAVSPIPATLVTQAALTGQGPQHPNRGLEGCHLGS